MIKVILSGIVGLILTAGGAAAQTAGEQAQILRDFEQSVVDYARHPCLTMAPRSIGASTAAPKIFTLPVAMVFRQRLARAIAAPGAALGGVTDKHRAAVLQPFPATELPDLPKAVGDALPPLPQPLEYRLIDNDLAIRDANADLIIAVLRDALGVTTTR
jgi:hypothetical protein